MSYQITRPDADQLKFTSSKTGDHVLEDYLQDAELGGKTLKQLLVQAFDETTGLAITGATPQALLDTISYAQQAALSKDQAQDAATTATGASSAVINAISGERTAAAALTNKTVNAVVIIDRILIGNVAGAVSLDLTAQSTFDYVLTGNTTFSLGTLPTLATNEVQAFVVQVSQGVTAYAVTWNFAGIEWITTGGSAPIAPASNKTIEYIFTRTFFGIQGRKGSST